MYRVRIWKGCLMLKAPCSDIHLFNIIFLTLPRARGSNVRTVIVFKADMDSEFRHTM